MYADLHIHTVYSSDSLIQPKTLVDMLSAHNFIKVAAVTDHDSVRGVKATVELAKAYPDILIIPGVEISTVHGDALVLGTDELPPKPWSPECVVDYAKSIGAITSVAHPFREYGMGTWQEITSSTQSRFSTETPQLKQTVKLRRLQKAWVCLAPRAVTLIKCRSCSRLTQKSIAY